MSTQSKSAVASRAPQDVPRSLAERIVGNPRLILMVAAGLFAATITAALTRPAAPPALPVLGAVPAFSLDAQNETAFGSDDLRGRVWIANFIFTRCPTVCPVFTQKMARVQGMTADFGGEPLLVSFSVDPEYDTPARLRTYAAKFDADPARWTFLTGLPEQVRTTVRDGLKISMENEGLVGDVPNIIHGTHFVLVDRAGQIRGYYDSNDPARVEALVSDAGRLIEEAPPE